MNLLHLLASDGFICVNKHIIQLLGLEEAVLLGELVSTYTYNDNKDNLEEGWFYATVERIKTNTGLSEHKQQITIDRLCEIGILKQKLMGMPRKRYFMFDEAKLMEILTTTDFVQFPKNWGTSSLKIGEQAPQKLGNKLPKNSDTIYNNKNNNRDNNNPKGVISNKNTMQILEKESTNTSKPRVVVPSLHVGSRLPNKVKAKILNLKTLGMSEQCTKSLTDYCLYLMDSYAFKDTALCKRVDDICRQGRNVAGAIQAICNYNIDRNYKNLYLPNDLFKVVAQEVVISEQATKDDFVRDEDGNIEEVW